MTTELRTRSTRTLVLAAASLLLVPLVAMQFTDDVVWDLFDFAVAGVLLIGTALTYDFMARRMGGMAYKAAVGVALGAALLLVWANLAVGLIGSEDNVANVMYIGVLVVGFVGAGLAHLRPRGMARSMFAMAGAQAVVAVIALVAGEQHSPVSSVAEIVNVNAFFAALFVVSALLFQAADRGESAVGLTTRVDDG